MLDGFLGAPQSRAALVNLERGLNAAYHWPGAREGLRLHQLEQFGGFLK